MKFRTELAIANNLAWLRVIIFFIPIWTIAFLSSKYLVLDDIFVYLFVTILISWCMLHLEGKGLSAVNALPKERKHWRQILWGTVAGIVMLLITALLTNFFNGQYWIFNKNINIMALLMIFFMNVLSAYLQEFTYRGYPFQTLLNCYGRWVAQIVIIIPFGIMHLHWNMSAHDMFVIFLTTGFGSLLYGEAYIKTKNLSLPFALHFGWNLAQSLLPRHTSQNGNGIFEVSAGAKSTLGIWFLVPYFLVMVVAYLILKFRKSVF